MTEPHYAFYVLADELDDHEVRKIAHGLHLDQVWIRVVPTTARYETRPLLQVEIVDVTDGQPVFADAIGRALSADERTSLIVGHDPEEKEVACGLYIDGEEAFLYAGELADFEARDEESGREYQGERGFFEFFQQLAEAPFSDFTEAASVVPEAREIADDNTALLLRGRLMRVPAGAERDEDVCVFHDAQQWDDEGGDDDNDNNDGDNEEPTDRVALVLLDPELIEFLWNEAPAAQVGEFLDAITPIAPAILGPLVSGLDQLRDFVATHPQDEPLSKATTPEIICYEVLCMATAVGFLVGDTVEFFSERFLPLLSLGTEPASAEVVEHGLDDIEDLPILSAMTEVMPYSVPEGELMECIADDEVAPLARWALDGDAYEGSIFLLETARLEKLMDNFSPENVERLADAFLANWHPLARPGATLETWKEERAELDGNERVRVAIMMNELAYLLALRRVNELSAALVFYAG